jgi:oxygen-independent coproporphyrinogen-3 oxidase
MTSPRPDPVRLDEPLVQAGAIRSLYVHAPFCSRRCFYCDFAVKVAPKGDAAEWSDALAEELSCLEQEGLFLLGDSLNTLYVGGGTPSLLGPGAMEGLRRVVGAARLQSDSLEWTSEANPESFTSDVAEGWIRSGVNRVSLGVQSFHEPSLRWMGRLHGADGADTAVRTARAAGFENLSVDLIFGLPEHLGRDLESDLDRVLALDVDHVSLYGLSVESGTPLGRSVAEGREVVATEERYESEYLTAVERLTSGGYEAYEVSNLARSGRVSRHNMAYWSGEPYLGLGNGAHSYHHPVRRWNLRDWDAYRVGAAGGSPPVEDHEQLDHDKVRLERIWLGLRTTRGVEISPLPVGAKERVDRWIDGGLAVESGGAVRLTPAGWLIMDRLTVELDREVSPVD